MKTPRITRDSFPLAGHHAALVLAAAMMAGVDERELPPDPDTDLRAALIEEFVPPEDRADHGEPYLVIDWTALRIGALEEAKVRDFDERRHVFLARASVAKNEKPVWLALQDVPRLTTEQRSTAD